MRDIWGPESKVEWEAVERARERRKMSLFQIKHINILDRYFCLVSLFHNLFPHHLNLSFVSPSSTSSYNRRPLIKWDERFVQAPETVASDYTWRAGVYSFGIIMFEIIHPFHSKIDRYNGIRSLRSESSLPLTLSKHPIIKGIGYAIKNRLVVESPEIRPTMNETYHRTLFRKTFLLRAPRSSWTKG